MRKILSIAAVAAALLIGTASGADASVTDTFIGKGDVQTAFGFTNAKMQTAIGNDGTGVTFTSEQPASQAYTQDVEQSVTEHATQSVHRTLSCTITVGSEKNPVVFTADGYRDAIKSGSREGVQTGSQAGSLDGVLNASIDTKARKTGQWTGWYVNGFKSGPTFVADGEPQFSAPTFDAPTFDGDYVFTETTWSGWVSDSQKNPADCDRNSDKVSDYNEDVSYGEVVPVPEATEYGEVVVTNGPTKVGTPTATGPAKVFATIGGVTKAIN